MTPNSTRWRRRGRALCQQLPHLAPEVFLAVLQGKGFAEPNPRPMFPNPPGLLRLEPHSEGLRERIWWGGWICIGPSAW